MALSSLTQLLAGSLPRYTAYNPAPTSQYSNPNKPETEVSFTILGYLNTNANVMVFQVNDAANTGSSLTIDNSKSTNDITVADSNSPNVDARFMGEHQLLPVMKGAPVLHEFGNVGRGWSGGVSGCYLVAIHGAS